MWLQSLAPFSVALAGYFLTRRISPTLPFPHISRRTADVIVGGMACAYTLTFSTLTLLRYRAFNLDGYDLSIFHQAIWNSLNGRLLETTVLPDITFLLSQRFSPILLAFVPLYAIWADPMVLLIVQTLALAFAGFPIYWFARWKLGAPLGVIVAMAYYLFPATQFVNLFEFHEIALALPLFALATFFLLRDRIKPFLICLACVLLVKEDMAFVLPFFGIYVLWTHRSPRLGIGLILFGIAWSIALLQFILPYFYWGEFGKGYYYFGNGIAAGVGRYDYLGHSFGEILTTLVTRPAIWLSHVFTFAKFEYVLNLFAPLAFLPLVNPPLLLLALPTLGISLLSDYAPQFSIHYHYTASLIPFLFFALVAGIARLIAWRAAPVESRARKIAFGIMLALASIIGYAQLSAGPLGANFDPALYVLNAHTALGQQLLAAIPPDARVITQGDFMPNLAGRQFIYGFPAPLLTYCDVDLLVADRTRPRYARYQLEWLPWLTNGYFETVAEQDGYLVARRPAPNLAVQQRYGNTLTLTQVYPGAPMPLRGGNVLCPVLAWHVSPTASAELLVHGELQDQAGHTVARAERNWNTSTSAAQLTLGLDVPPTTAAGNYQLVVSVFDRSANQWLNVGGADQASVTSLSIEKNTASFTANELPIEIPFFVDLREMRVLGYTPLPTTTLPNATLPIGIYWRARGKPAADYTIAVQMVQLNGTVVAEQASRPASETYPTTRWSVGEVLLDWHDLSVPTTIAPGGYNLQLVLRNATTNEIIGVAPIKTITVE